MEGRQRINNKPSHGLNGYYITDSSNVRMVAWDDGGHMYVAYASGNLYRYEQVSRQRAVATALASSVGKYLAKKIKPTHDYLRII